MANRIARALGKIGGEFARDGLLKAVNSPDAKVRVGIVQALGEFMGDEKVARALKKIAKGDVGKITSKLKNMYMDIVLAKSEAHLSWLTFLRKIKIKCNE